MINDAKTKGKTDFFFVEAALLIETGFDKICDELWYIYAQKKVRIQRLKESRGYTEKQIDDMFDRQLSEAEFRKHCQVVIDNSGELEESIAQIRGILEGYLRDN
jgi:dephospho-CoA kinase